MICYFFLVFFKWFGVFCIYIFVVEVVILDELVVFKCVDKVI